MPDSSRAWLPTIRLVGVPKFGGVLTPSEVRDIPALPHLAVKVVPEPTPQPQQVSFVPHRGGDNLIDEIVASEDGETTWTFVVERDENNLIVEVVAYPQI